jgi:hypothetical protein
MLSQEEIYQRVFNEDWSPIIHLLHAHKKDISSDEMLSKAASVFEHQFFSKVVGYPIEQRDVLSVLENLFILQSGKFYLLQPENFQKLLQELVKRLPLESAYNYAKMIPDDELAKNIIQQHESDKAQEAQEIMKQKTPANWTEIYNRLFELFNIQNSPTYFSGSRFFDVVKEFQPYYADYSQYIKARAAEGKSTSRKIYFYDVLMALDDVTRNRILARFLIFRPS